MPSPVLGFLAFTSGSYEGAIIRDMRLASELHRRGYKVHVYWMMEKNPELLDAKIPQRWLVRALGYHFRKPSAILDLFGKAIGLFPAQRRRLFLNQHPDYVARLMGNLMHVICDGGRSDPGLLARLETWLIRDGITHLLPTFAWTRPLAQRIKERGRAKFDYLPTFQGEEIFAHFAMRIGRLDDYHRALRETVAGSPWPAVAVSHDYIGRLQDEMGIDPTKLHVIYPGIELPEEEENKAQRHEGTEARREDAESHSKSAIGNRQSASPPTQDSALSIQDYATLRKIFPSLQPNIPLITYLGRQDPEKGIDLLLYAARMLADRKIPLQLICVGGSSFGLQYRKSMEAIAEHLRLTVFWKGRVSNEIRTILFRKSRCIVYPSIHREPFGMVAAEAMSYGTPVLVPALGGIQEVINIDGKQGGLAFAPWDSADLARQLEKLLTNEPLYNQLAANTKWLAQQFTVEKMTDQVLEHMGLPKHPKVARATSP